jgi:DNA-binding NarL/FixJ family response regulator
MSMTSSAPTRVAIVDGHSFVRAGLRVALSGAGMDVVGEAGDVDAATVLIQREQPDVAIVETALHNGNIVDRIREWRELTRVLVLSGLVSSTSQAFANGAHGVALKSERVSSIIEAVRTVARGTRYVAPVLQWKGDARIDPLNELSAREHQVFDLVIGGFSTENVAAMLGIAPHTVETHRSRINRKLDAHSAADLVRLAALRGLLRDGAVRDESCGSPEQRTSRTSSRDSPGGARRRNRRKLPP